MALYIPHSIFHLARLLYVRPETFGPYYVSPVYGESNRKLKTKAGHSCQKSVTVYLQTQRHSFFNTEYEKLKSQKKKNFSYKPLIPIRKKSYRPVYISEEQN